MKPVTLFNIVEYFTDEDATWEMYEHLRDSVTAYGFDQNVPIAIQGCVNCYLFCEAGEEASRWFHEVCKRIGCER